MPLGTSNLQVSARRSSSARLTRRRETLAYSRSMPSRSALLIAARSSNPWPLARSSSIASGCGSPISLISTAKLAALPASA